MSGWYSELRRAKKPATLAAVYLRMSQTVQLFRTLPILSFTEPAIQRYDALKKLKLNIGKMDLRIAATVLENGATLVTCNLADFLQVPGLLVED
ncbi:type II toxin-antitoxin system VapC family toxin [Gemmata sp.]|uniref:type II toxin-antitoxin system VapC family toxin n=1 Tax=Gemmata sp. TaxID=1914242 RepID=UPI003F72C37A